MTPERKNAIKGYQRTYEDPIALDAGEVVTITKQDLWDDQYLWLWCVATSGKVGWVLRQAS